MAKKRNSLTTFSNRFKPFMLDTDNRIIRGWSLLTEDTLTKAQRLAPVASGTLEGSGDRIKARLTPKGIESFVLFKVPYAAKLNDRDANIRLKNKDELSYYANGTAVNKRRKGRLGFLDIAVKSNKKEFIDIIKGQVSTQFIRI